MKPIFLDLGSLRGGFMRVWVWAKLFIYVYISCFTITKSRKNTVFFPCNIDLCRAMLPNYLGTYYSALCQILALEEAVEERIKCQSYPKKWGFGCMHLIGQKKQSTFRCNILCISPATMTCIEQCCQTIWGRITHFCAKSEL